MCLRRIWLNNLLIPACVASLSATILLLHRIVASSAVKRLAARVIRSRKAVHDSDDEELDEVFVDVPNPNLGVLSDIKAHIDSMGGSIVFFYKMLRFVGCLVLVGLTIATLVLDEHQRGNGGLLSQLRKRKEKKAKKRPSPTFTTSEWLQIALALTYVCHVLFAKSISIHISEGLRVVLGFDIGIGQTPMGTRSNYAPRCVVAHHHQRLCVSRYMASSNIHKVAS